MKIHLVLGALLLAAGCSSQGGTPASAQGSAPGAAQDAAALYRSRCQACHGADGAGRPAIQGSNLLTDAAKKASDGELADFIARGGPKKLASHAYEARGVTPAQTEALVKFIRTLQSQQKP